MTSEHSGVTVFHWLSGLTLTRASGFSPSVLLHSCMSSPVVLHHHPHCATWKREHEHRWQQTQTVSPKCTVEVLVLAAAAVLRIPPTRVHCCTLNRCVFCLQHTCNPVQNNTYPSLVFVDDSCVIVKHL